MFENTVRGATRFVLLKSGHYELIGKLGEGDMGAVYPGRQTAIERV